MRWSQRKILMRATPEDWKQLFKLADEAFELAGDARESWMQRLAPEHAHLAPLLRDLFAEQSSAKSEQFLNTLPAVTIFPELLAIGRTGMSAQPASSLQAGSMVGPYRLLREVGLGGMGAVWLAERADGTLKRTVALKLPYAGPFQQQIAERFARERDILAALAHKNIARLYDAGATELGQPYLAMEFIEGVPITQYCDTKRLTVDERVRLFRQVLSAVQYAHSNLVLHRDLKPTNILVNGEGTVSLLDFGIAKVMSGSEVNATEITQVGGAALTPDYASPEQINGTPLSTASDVYSLGVILFELLAGARPYHLKRGTRGELEEAITSAEATRPSRAAADTQHRTATSASTASIQAAAYRQTTPEKLSRVLKGDLDTIVLKALKKKPIDRYATVAALDDDLARYLRGDTVLARPDRAWYRLKKFAQRNKWAVASVGAVVLALAVGMSAAMWQAREANRQANLSDARAAFWADLFAEAAPRDHTKSMPSIQDLLNKGETLVPPPRAGQTDVQAMLYADLARVWRSIGSYHQAIPLYEQGLAQTEAAFGKTSQEANDYRISMMRHYGWGMQYPRLFALEPTVRELCGTAALYRNERCARAGHARAYAYINAGHLLAGEKLAAQDLALVSQIKVDGNSTYARQVIEGQVAKSRILRGDVLRGRPAAMQALKELSISPGSACSSCLFQTVQALMTSGTVANAKPYVDEFMRRHDAGAGGYAYVGNELLRVAASYFSQIGEYERSTAMYKRVLDASLKNFGPDTIDMAHAHRELGLAHLHAGKAEAAKTSLAEAARIHMLVDPRPNHWVSQIRILLAGIDVARGDRKAGVQDAVAVLQTERESAVREQDDANLSLALYWLARATEDDAAAIAMAREALTVMRRGGRGRVPLAAEAHLFIVERSADLAERKRHAARAREIVRYTVGANHGFVLFLENTLKSRGLLDETVVADAADAAMDAEINAQDALLRAQADVLIANAKGGKL